MATFVVEKSGGTPVEVDAETAEQDAASTRVSFKDGEGNVVASFINVQAWYKKPSQD